MSDAPGCHHCGAMPLFQWTRRATESEAVRQREQLNILHARELSDAEIETIHGPLREAVFGCAKHHLGPESEDDSETAPAAAVEAGAQRRTLLHDADCGGHGSCSCTGTP